MQINVAKPSFFHAVNASDNDSFIRVADISAILEVKNKDVLCIYLANGQEFVFKGDVIRELYFGHLEDKTTSCNAIGLAEMVHKLIA